jgi:hypothetical protein
MKNINGAMFRFCAESFRWGLFALFVLFVVKIFVPFVVKSNVAFRATP